MKIEDMSIEELKAAQDRLRNIEEDLIEEAKAKTKAQSLKTLEVAMKIRVCQTTSRI